MPELMEGTPSAVLAVYAHPDDAEVSCGGTLALWAANGAAVHVLTVTGGDKGTSDPAVRPADLAAQRAGEMEEASKVLGLAGRIQLGLPDGEVEDSAALRESLVAAVRSVRPEVVVCPDPTAAFFGQEYVNHRDHRVVGWCALDAVAPAAAMPLYFPAAGPPHQTGLLLLSGTLDPDVAVDVSATLENKIAALQCHRSQVGADQVGAEWVESLVRRRAEEAGRSSNVRYAETFRRQYVT